MLRDCHHVLGTYVHLPHKPQPLNQGPKTYLEHSFIVLLFGKLQPNAFGRLQFSMIAETRRWQILAANAPLRLQGTHCCRLTSQRRCSWTRSAFSLRRIAVYSAKILYLKFLRNKKYLEEYHWKFHVWFFETLWDVLKQVDMSSTKWRRYYHAQGRFHHAFSSLQVRLEGLFGNTSAESIYACPSVSTANSKHSKLQRDELQMTAIYFAVLFFSFSREEEPARWRPCSWWTYHCW